jgi:phosphoglycerate dehydrogenase-like enzyme
LLGQKAVLFGFGSIGARLTELLAPFRMRLVGVRDRVAGNEPIPTLTIDDPALLTHVAEADHVINLLPLKAATWNAFDRQRLGAIRRGAVFYNIGRGNTVDQEALIALLRSEHLGAAWLDVMEPEPLPAEHPLWSLPNCYITPHSGGGHHDEQARLIDHFVENMRRFERGEELLDRVV